MEGYQTTTYKIADIWLRVNTPWEEERSKAFVPFVENAEESCDWEITLQPVSQFERQENQLFYNELFRACKKTQDIYVRQYCDEKCNGRVYASVYTDIGSKKVTIEYLPEVQKRYFGADKRDFFYITLEKILLEENALILHAACVDTPYGGLLFSGVSGAGKSTQADLWCKYGQGRLINGDRPIIKKSSDGWNAYGSPYAGSSGCHLAENCKIRAIVLPKKSNICGLRKIEGAEKFRKVFANLTLNMWDSEFVAKAGYLTQELISEIPVYELSCTMEEEAVLTLKTLLDKECEAWN